MKKIRLLSILVLIFCAFTVFAGILPSENSTAVNASAQVCDEELAAAGADLWDELARMLWPKPQKKTLEKVILGGIPVGIALEDRGVQVVGFTDITTEGGKKCPATEAGLKVGDRIISLGGQKVTKTR